MDPKRNERLICLLMIFTKHMPPVAATKAADLLASPPPVKIECNR